MNPLFHYWQLMRLDSSGHAQPHPLVAVKTWFQQHCADLMDIDPVPHKSIQRRLMDYWRSDAEDRAIAGLSLRCYASHAAYHTCHQLAQQFGSFYQFTARDLFPFVLDDRGQPQPSPPPFTLTLLEHYDPHQARLNTWASHLTRNSDRLNQYLLVMHGLYRVSDWAILNDTQPDQLTPILGEYHHLSAAEVETAQQLLHRYHQVYRLARLQRRKAGKTAGRCLPPTTEQLQRIDAEHSPEATLTALTDLARLLRIYRIEMRGGNPDIFRQGNADAEAIADIDTVADQQESDDPTEADEFLNTYRTHFNHCLPQTIGTVIQSRLTKLQKRSPLRGQAYVEGLRLFHCVGKRLGAIAQLLTTKFAPDVTVNSQSQATRLLDLRSLRQSVRNQMIPQLRQRVEGEAAAYLTAEQLRQMAHTLDQILAADIDQVMQAAEAEAYSPVEGAGKSLFAYHLCQTIHQFRS